MAKYVVEGKIHFGEGKVFIEAEKDKYGNPLGTWFDEMLQDHISEGTNVSIVVETKTEKSK